MLKSQSILGSSAHWYDGETGLPTYELPCKSTGKTRRPTVRDARKLGLVTSVTSIIKDMVPAPGLVNWKMRQLFNASQATARQDGETDDALFLRLCNLAGDEGALTADLGTRTHDAIDKYEEHGLWRFETDVQPLFDAYLGWRKEAIAGTPMRELYIPPRFGYGGRLDMIANRRPDGAALIDVKTKKTKPGEAVFRADEHGLQLAAYAQAVDLADGAALWILAISTTEPGRIEVVDFTDERKKYTDWFNHLLEAWFLKTGYDPRKVQ